MCRGKEYYFSLLVLSDQKSPIGVHKLEQYKEEKELLKQKLPHRYDGLINLMGIGLLTWQSVKNVLKQSAREVNDEMEKTITSRAVNWLTEKGI